MLRRMVFVGLVLAGGTLTSGCAKRNARTPGQVLNSPRTEMEGRALMRNIEREGMARAWPPAVNRHMRGGLKGRLLTAGMEEREIDAWIASAATPACANAGEEPVK